MDPALLSRLKDLVKKWTTSNDQELFALDSTSNKTNDTVNAEQKFSDIDDCIDTSRGDELFSLAKLVRGQPQKKKTKKKHLRPIAFLRLNTRRGKPKPATLKVLLDSGASESVLDAK